MAAPRNVPLVSLVVLCATFLGACGDPSRATAPVAGVPTPTLEPASGPALVECPTETTLRATGTIGLLGGTISAGGTSIKFPIGAVLAPTEFELVVPASRYMEIEVHAAGQDHYQFALPVSITMDVSRCAEGALTKGPVSVFYIDGDTKSLLENVGGVLDLLRGSVGFSTDHFSGYAIAN